MHAQLGTDNHLVTLNLDYSIETIKGRLTFEINKNHKAKSTGDYLGADRLTKFLENLQLVYKRICETLYLQPHVLEISKLRYPTGKFHFSGIQSAIHILRDLLVVAPEYISSFGTQSVVNNGTGGVAVQQEHSFRQLEVLTPIIRDMTKLYALSTAQAAGAAQTTAPAVAQTATATLSQPQIYLQRCLVSTLGPDVRLRRNISFTG